MTKFISCREFLERKQKQKYLCIIREKEHKHNTNTRQERIIKANTQQTTHNTKKACNNTHNTKTGTNGAKCIVYAHKTEIYLTANKLYLCHK